VEGSGHNTDWHYFIQRMNAFSFDDARARLEFFARISPNRTIDVDAMLILNSQGYGAGQLWRRRMAYPTGGPSPFLDCHLILPNQQEAVFSRISLALKNGLFSQKMTPSIRFRLLKNAFIS